MFVLLSAELALPKRFLVCSGILYAHTLGYVEIASVKLEDAERIARSPCLARCVAVDSNAIQDETTFQEVGHRKKYKLHKKQIDKLYHKRQRTVGRSKHRMSQDKLTHRSQACCDSYTPVINPSMIRKRCIDIRFRRQRSIWGRTPQCYYPISSRRVNATLLA